MAAPSAVTRRPEWARLRWVKVLLAVSVLAMVALGTGFLWFVARASRADPAPPVADGIVVLTGGAGRVELALQLLAEGQAPLLLVSGTGPGDLGDIVARAGIAEGLTLRVPESAVTLGRGARSTRGNARETADWVAARNIRALVVVTSGYHMPRALAELRRTLPAGIAVYPAALVPHASDGHDRPPLRLLLSEYMKLLGAWVGLSTWAGREDERPVPKGQAEGHPAGRAGARVGG